MAGGTPRSETPVRTVEQKQAILWKKPLSRKLRKKCEYADESMEEGSMAAKEGDYVLSDRFVEPDVLNRHRQAPLMLGAMHGKIWRVRKLIAFGANGLCPSVGIRDDKEALDKDCIEMGQFMHVSTYVGKAEQSPDALDPIIVAKLHAAGGLALLEAIKYKRAARKVRHSTCPWLLRVCGKGNTFLLRECARFV
ncbi:hypothetical protein Vadar_015046 [Vaccinium darrowii]|uniref:Uncharacterized protein n=1 Tax=Vaccinium darrowii TaxID=229202 RepID=A0ACB7YN30_9ERIC|nr:hypothetical protein Vadar_015046 [Vaccinium darrowii]